MTTNLNVINVFLTPVEDEYQALVRALRRKQGFGIFFVECDPAQGAVVAQRLLADLADQRVQVFGIATSGENLYKQVEAQWQLEPFDVLLLQGLERDVVAFEDAKHRNRGQQPVLNPFLRIGVPPVLHHLNQQRERFRDQFLARFVLFVPPFLVDYFIQQAPDFFDWRSGLFRISRDLAELDNLAQGIIAAGDWYRYANQASLVRIQQIWEIKDLLRKSGLSAQRRASLLTLLGHLYDAQSQWQDAIATYEESLQSFRALGDTHGVAQSLNNLGLVYDNQGRWDDAIATYEESLQIQRALGDTHGVAQSLNNLGNVYDNQGRWDDAIATYEESLQSFRALGDTHGVATTLNNLGIVYGNQGRWDDAIATYEESLQSFRALGDTHGVATTLGNLGLVYRKQGRWDDAIAAYEQDLQISRALGDTHGVAQTLNNLGLVYDNQGRWDDAIATYEESLQIKRALGDTHGVAQTLGNLGNVYGNQGRWDDAIATCEESLQSLRALGDTHSVAQTLNNLGVVYKNQGRWDDAIATYEESLQIKRALGDTHGEGQTLANLGLLCKQQGKIPQAQALWQEALTKLHPSSPKFQTVQKWLANPGQPAVNYGGCLIMLAIGLFLIACVIKGQWLFALGVVLVIGIVGWGRQFRRAKGK